jgi:hypothetical protein
VRRVIGLANEGATPTGEAAAEAIVREDYRVLWSQRHLPQEAGEIAVRGL